MDDDSPLVYLAGPISDGSDPFRWHKNIQSKWGNVNWINPFIHHSVPQSEARENIQNIISKDIELVLKSDAVLLRRIEKSNLAGASIEAYVAASHEIPVIIWNDASSQVPLFLEGHSEGVYQDLDEAVNKMLQLV